MGWTNPRTWVASEVVTAAIMNAHVRDNLNAINGYVEKSADQNITSSTTLTNDTHLLYTVGAVGTYVFDAYLYATSAANAAGDLAVGFSVPTGTCHFGIHGADPAIASGNVGSVNLGALLSATSGTTLATAGLSTSAMLIWIHGRLSATATGTLRLMWAQASSSASASTLKAGSHMTVRQVA